METTPHDTLTNAFVSKVMKNDKGLIKVAIM
jgi:hypothetical protein